MDFKKNDIVRLRNEYFDKIKSKIFFPQNYAKICRIA